MISYNDLYEILRKEKYSENLQPLPKNFIDDFKAYISNKADSEPNSSDLFADSIAKSKKQLENAISLFKELILRRKRKILNLVFVATETGIMKRDYENMLSFEKATFDKMVKNFEDADKELSKILNNKSSFKEKNILIMLKQDIEQFINHNGKILGPFKTGDLINVESEIALILLRENKAVKVDQD